MSIFREATRDWLARLESELAAISPEVTVSAAEQGVYPVGHYTTPAGATLTSTNFCAALQAAVDAADEAGGGDVVIPPGTWAPTAPNMAAITIGGDGVRIIGAGGAKFYAPTTWSTYILHFNGVAKCGVYGGTYGFEVYNESSTAPGVRLTNCTQFTLDRTVVERVAVNGGVHITGSTDVGLTLYTAVGCYQSVYAEASSTVVVHPVTSAHVGTGFKLVTSRAAMVSQYSPETTPSTFDLDTASAAALVCVDTTSGRAYPAQGVVLPGYASGAEPSAPSDGQLILCTTADELVYRTGGGRWAHVSGQLMYEYLWDQTHDIIHPLGIRDVTGGYAHTDSLRGVSPTAGASGYQAGTPTSNIQFSITGYFSGGATANTSTVYALPTYPGSGDFVGFLAMIGDFGSAGGSGENSLFGLYSADKSQYVKVGTRDAVYPGGQYVSAALASGTVTANVRATPSTAANRDILYVYTDGGHIYAEINFGTPIDVGACGLPSVDLPTYAHMTKWSGGAWAPATTGSTGVIGAVYILSAPLTPQQIVQCKRMFSREHVYPFTP